MSRTLYVNVNLFDGIHDSVDKDSWMLVDNDSGKFIQVGNGNQKPDADETVDLHDKYVMPGLVNAHTHVTWDPSLPDSGTSANKIETIIRTEKNLYDLLKSGVTYIRECGSAHDIDKTLSELEARNKLGPSPKIMPSGKPMSIHGGHGDLPNVGNLIDSPSEMRKSVRTNFKTGAKCTKVMATGGVMSSGDAMDQAQFTIDELKVAVEETHDKHAVIAAHAEGNPGILNAIEAGVDSIEHGCYVTNEEIDIMLHNKISLTPTLSASWCIKNFGVNKLPDWELKKSNDSIPGLQKNLHNAYLKGITMNLGTDSGTPYNDFKQTPKELELMTQELNFSNFDALSTSRHSAALMKLEKYGTLEPNKYADFLVLDNNPLENINAVQQENKSVYKNGQKQF